MTLLPPGPHGADGRMLASSLGLDPASILDLSMSPNPFAPDPAPHLLRHLADGALCRYPDAADESRAASALAEAIGVAPERVLVTNGGAEAISLVAAELGRGWADAGDFSLYRRHLVHLDPEGPRFRSDPHNPTGLLAGEGEEATVWDEAFYPLATGRWSRTATRGGPPGVAAESCAPSESRAPRDRPAIVLGSLTKLFGCPGLRLGYVIVPEDDGEALALPGLHRRLDDRRPRWSVGTPALAVLPDLLATADLPGWAASIADARRTLTTMLTARGFSVRPSDAPFVLVDDARGLRDRLAPTGVIVRDCASFTLPDAIRIAVPDADGLERLADALDRVGASAGAGSGSSAP